MAEGKGTITQNERGIIHPVITKIKRDQFIQQKNKIKRQREKLGIKIKPKAKGPNPMSIKKPTKKKEAAK